MIEGAGRNPRPLVFCIGSSNLVGQSSMLRLCYIFVDCCILCRDDYIGFEIDGFSFFLPLILGALGMIQGPLLQWLILSNGHGEQNTPPL